MLEKIIKHAATTKVLKIAAITHLLCLGTKLLFINSLPIYAIPLIAYARLTSLLTLLAIVALNGICTMIDEYEIAPRNFLLKDIIIACVTIMLTGLIFIDGNIEESTILFLTKELPITTTHVTYAVDSILAYFILNEIKNIFSYSNHSLETDFAQETIKKHACAFFVKVTLMLAILFCSAHIFNIDKLSSHLAKYILHIFDIAIVCAITSVITIWIAHTSIYVKNLFSQPS